MSFDFLITIVYCSEEQYETFVKKIKASNLQKDIQFDLIELLKLARQHTEHARQNGWLNENPNARSSSYKTPYDESCCERASLPPDEE